MLFSSPASGEPAISRKWLSKIASRSACVAQAARGSRANRERNRRGIETSAITRPTSHEADELANALRTDLRTALADRRAACQEIRQVERARRQQPAAIGHAIAARQRRRDANRGYCARKMRSRHSTPLPPKRGGYPARGG